MVLSMAAFALADSLVKVVSGALSSAQILAYLIGGAAVVFTTMALVQGQRLLDARALLPVMLLRYISEVLGMVGMVTALALIPISAVGAITQATPILAAVGAVLFLGEKVGWRRWTCIVTGFIGVLLIVQPGGVSFDSSVLWAVLALVALSVRDLTTRMVPPDMASSSLATFTMLASLPFAIAWVLWRGESVVAPETPWALVLPMIILGALGYMLLIASLRTAAVSVVMPFRYSRVVFLFLLGVWVFGERPDVFMLIGAVLIVLSGTYMMWRDQHVKNSGG